MSVTPLLDSVWAPCPQPPCPTVASARMHHSGGQTCWEDASVTVAGDESLSAPAGRRLRMIGRPCVWLSWLRPPGDRPWFSSATTAKARRREPLGSAHGRQRREAGGGKSQSGSRGPTSTHRLGLCDLGSDLSPFTLNFLTCKTNTAMPASRRVVSVKGQNARRSPSGARARVAPRSPAVEAAASCRPRECVPQSAASAACAVVDERPRTLVRGRERRLLHG